MFNEPHVYILLFQMPSPRPVAHYDQDLPDTVVEVEFVDGFLHGKSIRKPENPWEIHGKSMGNAWVRH